MAERLQEMPAKAHRGSAHPWHDWADGSVWKVTRGVDFSSAVESFRTQLYGKARQLSDATGENYRVDLVIDGDTVTFRIYVPDAD